jgi:hypothetical protein
MTFRLFTPLITGVEASYERKFMEIFFSYYSRENFIYEGRKRMKEKARNVEN